MVQQLRGELDSSRQQLADKQKKLVDAQRNIAFLQNTVDCVDVLHSIALIPGVTPSQLLRVMGGEIVRLREEARQQALIVYRAGQAVGGNAPSTGRKSHMAEAGDGGKGGDNGVSNSTSDIDEGGSGRASGGDSGSGNEAPAGTGRDVSHSGHRSDSRGRLGVVSPSTSTAAAMLLSNGNRPFTQQSQSQSQSSDRREGRGRSGVLSSAPVHQAYLSLLNKGSKSKGVAESVQDETTVIAPSRKGDDVYGGGEVKGIDEEDHKQLLQSMPSPSSPFTAKDRAEVVRCYTGLQIPQSDAATITTTSAITVIILSL